ncbi:MAG: DUF4843 domain-containing protein [Dysgonamonadaceae bacterium]|jgi:hypothetical protein|nr:DUF4843 domain-containing protein [Dysgonamonadaceae bacterium]
MNKIYIYLLFVGLLGAMIACQEEEIMVYHDVDYIQFSKAVTDSSTCSFLAYPNQTEQQFPIAVELIGMLSDRDREYKVSVFADYSTASTANYRLPDRFVLKAGQTKDTCYLTAIKTEQIGRQAVRLTLQIEETSDFKVGKTEKSAAIIYISNVISQPDWWQDWNFEYYYLGTYSDKKYRTFIEVTGVADVDVNDTAALKELVIIFKNYLKQKKDAGETIYEDDGTEMSVGQGFYAG